MATSWFNRFLKRKSRPASRGRRGRPAVARLGLEALETRDLMAVFANVVGGQLRVTDTTAADIVNLDHSGSTTFVNGTPFADSSITNGILIQVGSGGAGTGVDTVNLLATVKPVTVNGQFDVIAVNLGKAGSMQGILAPVSISNLYRPPSGGFFGSPSVTLDDSANPFGRNVTLNVTSGFFTVTGLAPFQISVDEDDPEEVFINGGRGGNTFTILDTPDGVVSQTELNTGEGNDTVNVRHTSKFGGLRIVNNAGSDTVTLGNAGSVLGLEGGVNVGTCDPTAGPLHCRRPQGGVIALTVDASADTVARNVTMRPLLVNGPLRFLVAGLISQDPFDDFIAYDTRFVNFVTVKAGSGGNTFTIEDTIRNGLTRINTGTGQDQVFVHRTTGNLEINGQSGLDNVIIGSAPFPGGSLTGILGNVSITNQGSRTSLVVNGAADAFDRTVTLAGGSFLGEIRNLAPGVIFYTPNDIRLITLFGGSGRDTFFVTSTGSPAPLVINGLGGNDTFIVGNRDNTLDEIRTPLTLNGQSGFDTLIVNDHGSTIGHFYGVTASRVTRQIGNTVTIDYATIDSLQVNKSTVPIVFGDPFFPPMVTDLAFTESIRAGGLATLSGRLVDENEGDVLSLIVDWGDGSDPDESTPDRESFKLAHRYAAPGTYTVRVIWTDSTGESNFRDLTLTVAPAPPVIESVLVNDGSAQRSMVGSLTVRFGGLVSLDPGAFELLRADGTAVGLDVLTFEEDGRTVAALTFHGDDVVGGSLADGHYQLVLHGDLVHGTDGQALDGDADGEAGGDRLDAFFRLFGDSDGDGDVDHSDRQLFRSAYGSSAGDADYLWFLDHDGDGDIDCHDRREFRGRFGTALQS